MSLFDPPLDLNNDILLKVREVLIVLYSKKEAIEVANRAGLPIGKFPELDNMHDTWTELLRELAKQGKLRELVQLVAEEPIAENYKQILNDALDQDRPQRGFGAIPQPATDSTTLKKVNRTSGNQGENTPVRAWLRFCVIIAAIATLFIGVIRLIQFVDFPALVGQTPNTSPLADPTVSSTMPPSVSPASGPPVSSLVEIDEGVMVFGSDVEPTKLDEFERSMQEQLVPTFWIEMTEVTNAQYRWCYETGGCEDRPHNRKWYDNAEFNDDPVVYVSATQAQQYCKWVNRRLPSEVEWERAARGLRGAPWPWGSAPPDVTRANVIIDSTQPPGLRKVGQFPAGRSAEGVLDLVGNVWEWTATTINGPECHTQACTGAWDGNDNVALVQRGGGWDTQLRRITQMIRANVASTNDQNGGFRCATSEPPPTVSVNPESTITPTPTAGIPYVVRGTGTQGLSLRRDPNSSGVKLATVPEGARVVALGDEEDAEGETWLKVQYENQQGWVKEAFLQPE